MVPLMVFPEIAAAIASPELVDWAYADEAEKIHANRMSNENGRVITNVSHMPQINVFPQSDKGP